MKFNAKKFNAWKQQKIIEARRIEQQKIIEARRIEQQKIIEARRIKEIECKAEEEYRQIIVNCNKYGINPNEYIEFEYEYVIAECNKMRDPSFSYISGWIAIPFIFAVITGICALTYYLTM